MRFRVGSRTDIGRGRERNEDRLLIHGRVYAVADGMGGHRGGDVASQVAVETLEELEPDAADSARAVAERIHEANRRIMERGQADRALRGMGTTVTALVADGDKAHLAHVGDSRAYLLRAGAFQQLTEDHSLVQRMVREGKLTAEQAATHPQRNILTRALGAEEPVDVDLLTLDLHQGDRLLLCSDGLTSMLSADEVQRILARDEDPQRAADDLVEAANRAGGDDNITVIVLDVQPDPQEPAQAAAGGHEVLAVTTAHPVTRADEASPEEAPPEEAPPEEAQPEEAPPEEAPPEEAPPRHRRRRTVVWVLVVAAVVVAAILAFRAYVDRQWYVGESNGVVAIFNGIPSSVAGFRLSHVSQATDLPAAQVQRLPSYGDLRSGITANINSFRDAQALVDQMRRDLSGNRSGP